MARSFDNRRFPSGPLYGPDGKLIMRGPRRKVVGRVTPGDDVEVSREIERLWEWHTRLLAENNSLRRRLQELISRVGPIIPGYNDYDPSEYPTADFLGGYATFVATLCSPSSVVTLIPPPDGSLSVGHYRANYAAGGRLQGRIVCAFSDIDRVTIGVSAGDVSYTMTGGFSSGGLIKATPWMTVDGVDGSGYQYDESVDIDLSIRTHLGFSSGAIGDGRIEWRWTYVGDSADTDSMNGYLPTQPIDPMAQSVVVWDPTTQTWTSDATLDVLARLQTRLNSAGTVYERRRINFIEGAGIDLSAADDSANEEVDLTLTVDESELDITTMGGFPADADLFLDGTGAFTSPGGGRLNGVLYGTPALGTTRYLVIPRAANDVDATFDLERIHLRTETPSSSGSVVAVLQKSVGGESLPSWSDIGTVTLTVSEYEVDATIGAYTVTSDDLLRLYFTSIGTGCTDYQAIITGQKQ